MIIGAVKIKKWKNNQNESKKVYEGMNALNADDIADAILYMTQVPEKVNIADMVILPTSQANSYVNNRSI